MRGFLPPEDEALEGFEADDAIEPDVDYEADEGEQPFEGEA